MEKKYFTFFSASAILIAFVCLAGSIAYLFTYLLQSPEPEDIRASTMAAFNADRRMVLISTAFFIAMSFGFLGFASFLIDAKGNLDGEVSAHAYKVRIAKVSPGIFAMLCATVIIVYCSQFRIGYETKTLEYADGSAQNQDTTDNHDNLTDTSSHVDTDDFLQRKTKNGDSATRVLKTCDISDKKKQE